MANLIEIIVQSVDNTAGALGSAENSLAGLAAGAGIWAGAITAASTLVLESLGQVAERLVSLPEEFLKSTQQLENLSRATGLAEPQIKALNAVLEEHGLRSSGVAYAVENFNRALEHNNPLVRAVVGDTKDSAAAFQTFLSVLAGLSDQELANSIVLQITGGRMRDLIGAQAILAEQLPGATKEFERQGIAMAGAYVAADNLNTAAARLGRSLAILKDEAIGGAVFLLEKALSRGLIGGALGPGFAAAYETLLLTAKNETEPVIKQTDAFTASLDALFKKLGSHEARKAKDDLQGLVGEGRGRFDIVLEEQESVYTTRVAGGANVPESLDHFLEIWRDTHRKLGAITDGAVDGIVAAFDTMALKIGQRGETLGRVLSAGLLAFEQVALQVFARIAASAFLGFLGGLIGGPVGAIFGKAASSLFSAQGGGGATRVTGHTFVIQTFNPKDTIHEILHGSFRTANDRILSGED